jgi:hypothetical protein
VGIFCLALLQVIRHGSLQNQVTVYGLHNKTSPQKNIRRWSSAGEVKLSVSLNKEGILFVEFMEKGTIINSEWYTETSKKKKKTETLHPQSMS